MNYAEAKKFRGENPTTPLYMARYDGEVWSAGRMIEVGEVIGYFATKGEAEAACRDYEAIDFDSKHLTTSVEVCEECEFE